MPARPAALLLALAACGPFGADAATSDTDLGACPRGMRPVAYDSRMSLVTMLLGSTVTLETGKAKATGRTVDDLYELDLDAPTAVRGSAAGFDPVLTDSFTAERAAAATRAGSTLLVAGREAPAGPVARAVAAIRKDGRVAFVGPCAYGESEAVREFLASRGRPADVLRRILADPAGADARALRDQVERGLPAWQHRDPRDRHITDAPESARRDLLPVTVRLVLPDHWRDFPISICQTLTVAIGDCVESRAGTADLVGYLEYAAAVELRAKEPAGSSRDVGPLVTVPHTVARRAYDDRNLVLRVAGDPAIRDVDTLLRRGRDGPPPFAVTVVER